MKEEKGEIQSMRVTQPAIAGFEGRQRYEPKNAGNGPKLEMEADS